MGLIQEVGRVRKHIDTALQQIESGDTDSAGLTLQDADSLLEHEVTLEAESLVVVAARAKP